MAKQRNSTENHGLTCKQTAALPHLIAPISIENACRAAKINKTTYYGWLKDDSFKKELGALRAQTIDGAIDCLKAGIVAAVEKLMGLLNSKDESIKLRSAQTAIDYYLKIINAEQIESRLAALEKTINLKGGKS